jgi:short-subunit dehydrogenase
MARVLITGASRGIGRGVVNRPGMSGDSDVPRVARSRFA